MIINITRVTKDNVMEAAFYATCYKHFSIDKAAALKSEHSPIRCLLYWIDFIDVPQRVVNHLTRHKIGVEWFVRTSRPDRTDKEVDLRDMSCLINAQALITMSRTRLCNKAWHETEDAWAKVKEEMMLVDPVMATAMVPNCEYRGECKEMVSCRKKVVCD